MAEIAYDSVSKVYDDGTQAVYDLDLAIEDGELMVVVGPSGCGKTTALRMLAGLEEISGGEIRIGDRVVNDLTPKDRDVAMVFQNYALYPHMTVEQNLAFGLKLRKLPKDEVKQRVRQAAETLELEEFLKRKPRALSGGQRQRVAMGRAIVRQPAAFLMDEPLSNLDAKLRVQMRAEIARLQQDLGTTTIYVTHDQVEAMTMGDRVAVMRKGELQQVAAPQELYDHPVNLFVGGFIGSPAMNVLEARLEQSDGSLAVALGDQQVKLDDATLNERPALREYAGREIVLGIRPENLEDAAIEEGDTSNRTIRGEVILREALGSELMVHLKVDAKPAITEDVRELQRDVGGDEMTGTPSATESGEAVVVGRFDPHSRVQEGQTAEVAIDTTSLHFFDPETGLGIYDSDSSERSR